MEKYNGYSVQSVKNLAIKIQKIKQMNPTLNLNDQNDYNKFSELVDDSNCKYMELAELFFQTDKNPDEIIEKTYYRMGCPILDTWSGEYKKSFNFAEDVFEDGVSVITSRWLTSLKSVFFGAHNDEKIQRVGIYKIKGVEIATGGDDEPLIYPTDYAEKTDIKTFDELYETIIENEAK